MSKLYRVASNLENLEKSGNLKPTWKTWKSQGISLLVWENEECHKFTYNYCVGKLWQIPCRQNIANTLSLHLNSVIAECFKPGYCNI